MPTYILEGLYICNLFCRHYFGQAVLLPITHAETTTTPFLPLTPISKIETSDSYAEEMLSKLLQFLNCIPTVFLE